MSETFANETIRMKAFWALLQKEFGIPLHQVKYEYKTDGSWTHLRGLLVNIDTKNEIGYGGGAPHVQNAAFAFEADIHQNSVCPTLLIELAGPNMSFSGAVFADLAICDQLTPMVSLLWQPHSPLMLQAARCFTALRAALLGLRTFYDFLMLRQRRSGLCNDSCCICIQQCSLTSMTLAFTPLKYS